MKHSAAFWNFIARRYSNQAISDQDSYEYKLDETRKIFHDGMCVLELGCGTGGTSVLHSEHVAHIHATDLSENMIEIARGRAADAGVENVSFECISTDEFAFEGEVYDVVLALSLLHLLKNRREVIASIYKTLKPGGYFVSSTVCVADSMAAFKYIAAFFRLFSFLPYVESLSAEALKEEIVAEGFEVEHYWRPASDKAAFMIAKKPH